MPIEPGSGSAWLPVRDYAPCVVCRDSAASLPPHLRTVAADLALRLSWESEPSTLARLTVDATAAAFAPARASFLAPEVAGNWRVLASSEPTVARDLIVASERYPELIEVRRTGTPFLAFDVLDDPQLQPQRDLLIAAGVRSIAAFPVFATPGTGDPVILKLSLGRPMTVDDHVLARLLAHQLLHRFARDSAIEVSRALDLSAAAAPTEPLGDLLDLLPLAALVTGVAGEVRYANSRARWLLTNADTRGPGGQSRLEISPSPGGNVGRARWDAVVNTPRGHLPVVGWSRPLTGDRLLLLLDLHPAGQEQAKDGSIRRSLAAKVRELEEANALLAEHVEARARFVSSAAHELKTPLAILRSYLETITTDLAEGLSSEQREFLAAAATGAQRLHRLVEGLLDLAAIEGGHYRLTLGRVDLDEVVGSVLSDLAPLAAGNAVFVSRTAFPGLAARADRDRLLQVLRNLVENGIKYTPVGGTVNVTCSPAEDRVAVSVEDTGVGIPAEQLPRIFEEFVRVPQSIQVGGAGLGLAITRRLVQAMGGRVHAQSTLGHGSCFVVELPRWSDPS